MRQASFQIIAVCVFAFLVVSDRTQAQPPNFNPDRPDPNYTLVKMADGAVLTNKLSGRSWWLFVESGGKDKKPKATWLPINRVEDYAAAAKWLRANRRQSTEPVLDIEIAFAKKKLKQAKADYGARHPEVIKIAQDLRALLKEQEIIDKRRELVKKARQKKQAAAKKKSEGDNSDSDADDETSDSSSR